MALGKKSSGKEPSKLETRIAQLRANSMSDTAMSSDSKVTLEDIRAAVDTLKKSFDALESEYDEKIKSVEASFKKDLISLEEKHLKELADIKEQNRSELERLESLLKEQKTETENAQKRFDDHRETLDTELEAIRLEYDDELKRLEALVESLRGEAVVKDSKINELQDQLGEARSRLTEISSTTSADAKALDDLRVEYEKKIRDLNHTIRDVIVEKERAMLALAEAERVRDESIEKSEDTQNELLIAMEEVDQLKVRVSELEYCQRCEMYRSEIALKDTAASQSAEAVAAEIAGLHESCHEKDAKIKELVDAHEALDNSLLALRTELEVAKKARELAEKQVRKVDALNKKTLEKFQSSRKQKSSSVTEEHSIVLEHLDDLKSLLEDLDEDGNIRALIDTARASCVHLNEVYEKQRVESEKNRKMAEEAVLLSEKTLKGSKVLETSASKVVELETKLARAENEAVKRAQSLLDIEAKLDAERMRAQSAVDELTDSDKKIAELEQTIRMYEDSLDASTKTPVIGKDVASEEYSLKDIRDKFSVHSIMSNPDFLFQQSKMTQQRILESCFWSLIRDGVHLPETMLKFCEMFESSLPVHMVSVLRVKAGTVRGDDEAANAKSILDKLLICAMCDISPSSCLPPKFNVDFKSASVSLDLAVRSGSRRFVTSVLKSKDVFNSVMSRRDDIVAAALSACFDSVSESMVHEVLVKTISPQSISKLFVRAASLDNPFMFSILVKEGMEIDQSRITHLSKGNAVRIINSLPDIIPSIVDNPAYLTETMASNPGRVVKFLRDNRDDADKIPASMISRAIELKNREVIAALMAVVPEKFNDVFVQLKL